MNFTRKLQGVRKPGIPVEKAKKDGRTRMRVQSSDDEPPVLERQDVNPGPSMMAISKPKAEKQSAKNTVKREKTQAKNDRTQAATAYPDVNMYVVEKIVGKAKIGGVVHYRVKWDGFSMGECTWEPTANLKGCVNFIEEFEARRAKLGKRLNKRGRASARSNTRTSTVQVKSEFRESDTSESESNHTDEDWKEPSSSVELKKTTVKPGRASTKPEPKAEQSAPPADCSNISECVAHEVDGKDVKEVVFARPGRQKGSSPDYLVRYNDLSYHWLSSKVAIEKCPQRVIRYYSELIEFHNVCCDTGH